jgi:AmiR/NasT family two-component response regulator
MVAWLKDKLLPAALIAVLGAAFSMWTEVKVLRAQVDRLQADLQRDEVYLDQLWHAK